MRPLFTHHHRVLFSETDAAGVAHFSRVFAWAEEAEHTFWRQQGFAIHPSSASQLPAPLGWPRIQSEAQHHRPLKLDEELTLKLSAEILDESTLRWHSHIEAQEKLAATVWLTVVAVTETAHGRWGRAPIPPKMRDCLRLASDLGG